MISYAITVSSEIQEFKTLLNTIISWKRKEDEVVVLIDSTKERVEELQEICSQYEVQFYLEQFNHNFAEWKNKLNKLCNGDWIFQIDADEIPSEALVKNLPQILENTEADLIAVPRQNIVYGILPEDIENWNWIVTDKGINWPDYQWRLYKNCEYIKWAGKVHERPSGFKHFSSFSEDQTEYRLDHFKTIERQRSQNEYYKLLLS